MENVLDIDAQQSPDYYDGDLFDYSSESSTSKFDSDVTDSPATVRSTRLSLDYGYPITQPPHPVISSRQLPSALHGLNFASYDRRSDDEKALFPLPWALPPTQARYPEKNRQTSATKLSKPLPLPLPEYSETSEYESPPYRSEAHPYHPPPPEPRHQSDIWDVAKVCDDSLDNNENHHEESAWDIDPSSYELRPRSFEHLPSQMHPNRPRKAFRTTSQAPQPGPIPPHKTSDEGTSSPELPPCPASRPPLLPRTQRKQKKPVIPPQEQDTPLMASSQMPSNPILFSEAFYATTNNNDNDNNTLPSEPLEHLSQSLHIPLPPAKEDVNSAISLPGALRPASKKLSAIPGPPLRPMSRGQAPSKSPSRPSPVDPSPFDALTDDDILLSPSNLPPSKALSDVDIHSLPLTHTLRSTTPSNRANTSSTKTDKKLRQPRAAAKKRVAKSAVVAWQPKASGRNSAAGNGRLLRPERHLVPVDTPAKAVDEAPRRYARRNRVPTTRWWMSEGVVYDRGTAVSVRRVDFSHVPIGDKTLIESPAMNAPRHPTQRQRMLTLPADRAPSLNRAATKCRSDRIESETDTINNKTVSDAAPFLALVAPGNEDENDDPTYNHHDNDDEIEASSLEMDKKAVLDENMEQVDDKNLWILRRHESQFSTFPAMGIMACIKYSGALCSIVEIDIGLDEKPARYKDKTADETIVVMPIHPVGSSVNVVVKSPSSTATADDVGSVSTSSAVACDSRQFLVRWGCCLRIPSYRKYAIEATQPCRLRLTMTTIHPKPLDGEE